MSFPSQLVTLREARRAALGRLVIAGGRVLPDIGDRVLVCGCRDGRPMRAKPGRVEDRRGGEPRRAGKHVLPPKIVEYRVAGFRCWYKWFQLRPVAP